MSTSAFDSKSESTQGLGIGGIVIDRWDWFALILPAVALSPLLYLQSWFLWEKEHLQFFPLAFGAAAWFFWNEGKRDENHLVLGLRRTLSFTGAVASILVAIFALIIVSPWLAHFACVLLIFFWAYRKFASMSMLRVLGICGLMVVTIPPPFGLDHKLVRSLQTLSSTICSRLMDATNILHVKRGNVMEIASKQLFVEEACSGVDSQYALMAVAGVLLLVGNTGLIVSIITIVTVPIWAILGNLLRIYLIVVGLEIFGIDLSTGTSHTVLGLVVFIVAAWAHWSSVQLLIYLQLRFFSPELATGSYGVTNSAVVGHNSMGMMLSRGWLILPFVGVLLMPAGVLGIYNHFRARMPSISKDIADKFLSENDLPRVVLGQSRVGFSAETRTERNMFGQHSHVWTYQGDSGNQIVSLDFVFRDWHALWICYQSAGWTVSEIQKIDRDLSGNPLEWKYFQVLMSNDQNEFACLHFGFFNEDGQPYSYDGSIEGDPVERPLTFLDVLSPPKDLNNSLLFQVQVLSKSLDPIPNTQIAHQRQMFEELRAIALNKSRPLLGNLKGIR